MEPTEHQSGAATRKGLTAVEKDCVDQGPAGKSTQQVTKSHEIVRGSDIPVASVEAPDIVSQENVPTWRVNENKEVVISGQLVALIKGFRDDRNATLERSYARELEQVTTLHRSQHQDLQNLANAERRDLLKSHFMASQDILRHALQRQRRDDEDDG